MSHIILIRFGNLCLPDSFTHVVCGSSRSRRSCESNLLQIMRLLLLRLLLLLLRLHSENYFAKTLASFCSLKVFIFLDFIWIMLKVNVCWLKNIWWPDRATKTYDFHKSVGPTCISGGPGPPGHR